MIETILSLPSQRVEQRLSAIASLSEEEHYFVGGIDEQMARYR